MYMSLPVPYVLLLLFKKSYLLQRARIQHNDADIVPWNVVFVVNDGTICTCLH